MSKNILLLVFLTLGLLSFQSCIKKKDPAKTTTNANRPGARNAAAAKQRPGQAKQRPGQAARAKANKSKVAANTAGKPTGYWPSLRNHLGIDQAKIFKLKANEGKRMAELAKPGANAGAINTKYDGEAKTLLGPALFAKMQSFKMK